MGKVREELAKQLREMLTKDQNGKTLDLIWGPELDMETTESIRLCHIYPNNFYMTEPMARLILGALSTCDSEGTCDVPKEYRNEAFSSEKLLVDQIMNLYPQLGK